jgi:hypothetical protein
VRNVIGGGLISKRSGKLRRHKPDYDRTLHKAILIPSACVLIVPLYLPKSSFDLYY